MKTRTCFAAALLAVVSLAPATGRAAAPTSAPGTKDEPLVLSIFEVTSDKDEGYRSTQTVSGSRTLAALRDTPVSISVINRELLDDLLATRISDATFYSITGEIDTNKENLNESFVFRGIVANLRLRNGVTWYGGTTDTYALERVELLRGAHAFLYGEGTAGGLINQITKVAGYRDFQKANLIAGSYDTYRAELDVNRKLGNTFALRTALAYAKEGSQQHHVNREFKGVYIAANWRPFRNTTISGNIEFRINDGTMGSNMLADGFSTTDRTGTTAALTATTGGRVYIPALGISYDSTNRRRSTGTNIAISDERIMPREFSFIGPNAVHDSQELVVAATWEQKIGEALNVQVTYTKYDMEKWTYARVGSSSGNVYRDMNATLPNGQPNPYFNELYTEYYYRRNNGLPRVNDARITGVYDLKLPFMLQKIVGTAMYRDTHPEDYSYAETVDPASGNFKGSYNATNTLAAYTANINVMNQNYFYRRFYLKDGDRAELTRGGLIPGQSVLSRNFAGDSAAGRLSKRLYRTPAWGIGADGTYLNGRVHTLLGWRRSKFNQDPSRDFYNPISGETFLLDTAASNVHTRITEDSYTYGAVVNFAKFLGAYYSYADSVSLSSGFGGAQLVPGQVRGVLAGDSNEFGLRWSLMGGRIESNWTYYLTRATRNAADPAIPVAVRQTELGSIFGTEIDTTGQDTQSTRSTGFEFETTVNLANTWRLTWNFSSNDLEATDRYPALKAFQAAARAKNIPTPETDVFLMSAPEGTPLPGFTKLRSNLVTMYRFQHGPLKDISVGGGVQWRDKSYRGNFDLNLDGVAEELWSSGYTLYNLMFAYRTKIWERTVNFSLNINNVFDQDYFRSFALATGAWGDGRNFRAAARVEF